MLASTAAHAAPRAQQVPVSGTALAAFFASQGQSINVNTDQLDLQTLTVPVGTAFEVHTFGPEAAGTDFGTYNANGNKKGVPARYTLFPGGTTPGWYTTGAFRTGPSRLVVNLFDSNRVMQGSSTFNGANAANFALVDTGPNGTYYLEDARNAGGAAKILAFAGTGTRVGWTWFACETSSGTGGDFADFITVVNLGSTSTPTMHIKVTTKTSRTRSAMVRPAITAERAIGSERNRSIRPLWRSSANPMAVFTAPKATVCTKMPGIK